MAEKKNSKMPDWRLLLLIWLFALPSAHLNACDSGCAGGLSCAATMTFALPQATISADTLLNLLKSGSRVTLIECRSPGQKKNVSIPGAMVVLDGSAPADFMGSLPATNTLMIVYPALEGGQVASVTSALRENGYLSILEYSAGIHGWLTYGYETTGDAE